jgi:hypothetical protein
MISHNSNSARKFSRDVTINGNIMSLERYVLMQLISMKVRGLNGQGRLEEWVWRMIGADNRLKDWLTNPDQARLIIPYVQAYYEAMAVIIRSSMGGKFGLENLRDKRGSNNGSKEGIRHQMHTILWEEYNEFFRYLLGDPETQINLSQADREKIDTLRNNVKTRLQDLIDSGFVSSDKTGSSVVNAGAMNQSYKAATVKARFSAAAQEELKNAMKEFVHAADMRFGYKTERKHRMSWGEVSRLMLKYVLGAMLRGDSSSHFRDTVQNLTSRAATKAVFYVTAALSAFYLFNAIPQWGLMSVPNFVGVPLTATSVIGIVV